MAIRFSGGNSFGKTPQKITLPPTPAVKEVLTELINQTKSKEKTWKRGPARTSTKVSMRLDDDVLAHFKATGAGWQTRINDVLREYSARQKPSKL